MWTKRRFFPNISVKDLFTESRFHQILRFLHFADNSPAQVPQRSDPNFDALWKIRQFINMISQCFEREAVFDQRVSIDEMIIPYKGRLTYKVYIKNKPKKWGIKIYAMCTTDGYLGHLEVYAGKSRAVDIDLGPNVDIESIKEKIGESGMIVVRLLLPILNKNHIVFADNYYSSPNLVKFLLENKTYYVGTVQSNRRNFPKDLLQISHHEPRGTVKFATKGRISVLSWKDVRNVNMISSVYLPTEHVQITVQSSNCYRTRNATETKNYP